MEINLEKLAFNLDFHPLENLVSAALVNGDLLLYRFSSNSAPQKVSEVHAHTESCRAVHFIDDGRAIVMGPPDRLILATDVETGGPIARLEDAHGEAINKIINLHQSKIASRDDGGCIKVWDTRQRSYCGTCQAHEDYVSYMTFVPDAMKLLGTSVDETLSVCNLRKETFSEVELVSVVLVKSVCEGQTVPNSTTKILFGRENYFDLEMRRKELQGLLDLLVLDLVRPLLTSPDPQLLNLLNSFFKFLGIIFSDLMVHPCFFDDFPPWPLTLTLIMSFFSSPRWPHWMDSKHNCYF
ncbi:hypothetical protein UlMin_019501 [Ulmus minor]